MLYRKGYEKVSEDLAPNEVNRKLSFTLKKLIQGFIDVTVTPLQDIEIYVDELKVEGEGFPLRNYPVPANKKVTVKVIGSNGTQAQSTVQLKENQKQRLNFNLGLPTARSPSGE